MTFAVVRYDCWRNNIAAASAILTADIADPSSICRCAAQRCCFGTIDEDRVSRTFPDSRTQFPNRTTHLQLKYWKLVSILLANYNTLVYSAVVTGPEEADSLRWSVGGSAIFSSVKRCRSYSERPGVADLGQTRRPLPEKLVSDYLSDEGT